MAGQHNNKANPCQLSCFSESPAAGMSNAAQSARLMWAAPSFIHFLDFGSGQQAFSTTELHMPQDHIRTCQQLQDPRVPATQAEEAISPGQSLHHSATHCLEVGCRRSRGFMSGLPVTTSKTTQPKLHKSTALVNAACKATGPDTKFHSSGGWYKGVTYSVKRGSVVGIGPATVARSPCGAEDLDGPWTVDCGPERRGAGSDMPKSHSRSSRSSPHHRMLAGLMSKCKSLASSCNTQIAASNCKQQVFNQVLGHWASSVQAGCQTNPMI